MAALLGFSPRPQVCRQVKPSFTPAGEKGLPAPIVAETIAREGFNTVTIDQQHGLLGHRRRR